MGKHILLYSTYTTGWQLKLFPGIPESFRLERTSGGLQSNLLLTAGPTMDSDWDSQGSTWSYKVPQSFPSSRLNKSMSLRLSSQLPDHLVCFLLAFLAQAVWWFWFTICFLVPKKVKIELEHLSNKKQSYFYIVFEKSLSFLAFLNVIRSQEGERKMVKIEHNS